MAVDTPATIAILGAGPIGLEAGLYARFLGYDVRIYERGRVAENVRRWGHVPMFTPFGLNCSTLGRAALEAQDETYQAPADNQYLTGAEWADSYLLPLSQTDLLADHIEEQCEVVAVTRWHYRKGQLFKHEDRADSPFRLLVRDATGCERTDSADIVLDTTGVYQSPNWLGPGGGPALGERELRGAIEYHIPDVLGEARTRYADQRTLVVGSGYSAATTVVRLAELATAASHTRVSWITRGPAAAEAAGPMRRLENDRLPQRDLLARAANDLALSQDSCVEHLPGWRVERVQQVDQAWEVRLIHEDDETGVEQAREERFDQIVANVGYRPDNGLTFELHFHPCYATDGPIRLAASLMESCISDCLDQPAPGAQILMTPEPNFYVLGAKSFGRNSHFLFLTGLQQIRDVFSLIGDRAELNLYATARQLPQ